MIRPPPTPTRSLIGQQRLHPDPFLVGQIMTMQHQKDLPHPAPKIRGTRSSRRVGFLVEVVIVRRAPATLASRPTPGARRLPGQAITKYFKIGEWVRQVAVNPFGKE